jgi:hypothetical protein
LDSLTRGRRDVGKHGNFGLELAQGFVSPLLDKKKKKKKEEEEEEEEQQQQQQQQQQPPPPPPPPPPRFILVRFKYFPEHFVPRHFPTQKSCDNSMY